MPGLFAKVKAHLTKAAEARGEGHFWAGNDVVDRLTKGFALRALPPEELRAKIDDLCNGRRSFLRAAVRLFIGLVPGGARLGAGPQR